MQTLIEGERRCKKCCRNKPITEFEADPRYRGGRMPQCRACRTLVRKSLYKRRRVSIGDTKLCTKCKETKDLSEFTRCSRTRSGYQAQCSACRSIARKTQPHYDKRKSRDRFLRWKYGITLDEYEELLARQDGMCASCGKEPEEKCLVVDHCHQTNRVRELLCDTCNRCLGLLGEDADRIEKLARYARKHTLAA